MELAQGSKGGDRGLPNACLIHEVSKHLSAYIQQWPRDPIYFAPYDPVMKD